MSGLPQLAAELAERMRRDQEVRDTPVRLWDEDTAAQVRAVDSDNTAWIRGVLTEHGWPGPALVGEEGAEAAWLLCQHADADTDFQEHALTLLHESVAAGQAPAWHEAYLTDRTLVARGQPQVYGTQYVDNGDGQGWRMRPVVNPDGLDERRAAVGLGTRAENERRIRDEN